MLTALAGAVAVPASASASSATTLHLFSTSVSSTLYNWNFQPLGPNDYPVAGDRFVSEDTLYYGNHLNHSTLPVGTAHLFCTFRSSDRASCTGMLTINKVAPDEQGVLIGKDVIVNFNSPGVVVALTGGTGVFAGVKSGSASTVPINDTGSNDFTVVLYR